jgi:hypothetical protein
MGTESGSTGETPQRAASGRGGARGASFPLSRRQLLSATAAAAAVVSFPTAADAASRWAARSAKASATRPTVYQWQSTSAVPGGAIALNGAGFTAATSACIYVLPTSAAGSHPAVPSSPPSGSSALTIAASKADNLATSIPADAADGVYAVYVSNDGTTWTPPFLFNAPVLWYIDRVAATQGQTLRVTGTGLTIAGSAAQVFLRSSSGDTACSVVSADQYSVTFVVPATVAAGTYTVVVDNGALGASSDSLATHGSVAVGVPVAPSGTTYDVTAYGADPTGAADSYAAITSALTDAAEHSGGATVYFPAGTYAVSQKVTVPDAAGPLQLLGDGIGRSALTMTAGAPFSPDLPTGTATDAYSVGPADELSLLYLAAGDSPVSLKSLTLDTAGKRFTALGLNGRNNVTVDTVSLVCDSYPDDVWLYEGTTSLFALNNHDLDVIDTQITTSTGITLINSVDIRISGSTFSLFFPRAKGASNNPENGAGDRGIRGWGCKRVTIVGNTFQRGSTTYYYGGATLFGAQKVDPSTFGAADAAFAEDIYVNGNTVTDAGEPDSNDGEVFVGDQENGMPGTHVVLTVESATSTTATFAANTFATGNTMQDASGTYIFVLGGTGAGQVRRVASNTGSTLTLSQAWDVVPDATSAVVVTLAHVRQAYVGNTVRGCPKYVGMYGSAFTVIVADNTIDDTGAPGGNSQIGGDTGAGFHAILDANSENPSLYPVAYSEILRNVLTDAYAFVQGLAWATPPGNTPQYPMARGNVLADNTASGAEASAGLYTSTNGNTPATATWGRYQVVARNRAGAGTTYAASVSAAFDGTVIQQDTSGLDDSGTDSVLVPVS